MKKYFVRRTRVLSETVEVYAKTKNEVIAKSKDLSLSVYDTRSRWSRSAVIKAEDEFDPIELESLAKLAIRLSNHDFEIYRGAFIENNEITSPTSDYNTRGFVQSVYIDGQEIVVLFGDHYSVEISSLVPNLQIEILRNIVGSAKLNGVNLPPRLTDIKVFHTNHKYTSRTPWTVVDARSEWISLKRNRIVIEVGFDELNWKNFKVSD